jgi:F-type H+-transporting ATPase subunit b
VLHLEPSTFVLQILNFFILLAILSRFLYRPLLTVMQRREQEIADRLRSAEERAQLADAERQRLAERSRELEATVAARLAEATVEADRAGRQIVERARREAAETVEQAGQRAAESARAARAELEGLVRGTAVSVAGRLISQAAGPLVHQALVERLLDSGAGLTAEQLEALGRALANNGGRVLVELAYPPPPDLEVRCRALLAGREPAGSDEPSVEVRVEPGLLAGGRILVGTVAIDLSLKQTLEALSEQPPAVAAEGV